MYVSIMQSVFNKKTCRPISLNSDTVIKYWKLVTNV